MKKTVMVLAAMMVMACGKEGGNSGVIKEDPAAVSQQTPDEETSRYVAEDGSSAHVTFGDSVDGKYISIRSNNKTIRVKHETATDSGDIYREHDITVTATDSLVTIDQAGAVIELRKARGQ